MTYGNRYVNTNSPGGIRRGLIWQSSKNNHEPIDPRQWLFYPVRPAGTISRMYFKNPNNIVQMTGGLDLGDGALIPAGTLACTGFKIPGIGTDFQKHQAPCGYPYVMSRSQDPVGTATIISFADIDSYWVDVDFYVDPKMYTVGTADVQPNLHADQSGYYVTDDNWYEVTNSPFAGAYGYGGWSPGEVLQAYQSNNVADWYRLNGQRAHYASCPMRIKMRVVYSDYVFAMSGLESAAEGGARNINLQFSDFVDVLNYYLNGYTMPPDSAFVGNHAIQSRYHGNLYSDFNFPTFQAIASDRTEHNSSATANHKWFRYTKGALYDGLNSNFQMYLSPLLYPAICSVDGVASDDYTYNFPNQYDTYPDMSDLKAHASPYMILPTVRTPCLERIYYNYNVPVPEYMEQSQMQFVSGDFTSSSIYNNLPHLGPSIPTGNIRNGICGAHGVGAVSSSAGPESVPSIQFNNIFSQINGYDYITGYLQPKINKGEKYIRDFQVITAKGDTRYNSAGALSGRFKYLAFKGRVSFYETP